MVREEESALCPLNAERQAHATVRRGSRSDVLLSLPAHCILQAEAMDEERRSARTPGERCRMPCAQACICRLCSAPCSRAEDDRRGLTREWYLLRVDAAEEARASRGEDARAVRTSLQLHKFARAVLLSSSRSLSAVGVALRGAVM